ncbi:MULTISPECIES: hypothetical protein [Exiguobacterium]|uniref:hypothetical protein n=1 Tax=Exiguobacterium TaxID=33986 RepID=UPI001BEA2653|nr:MULTISPECIES: hypothetical protein [Exiguobacterium]MCT4782729.1 hypothetical protein [Exiguobacterium himgiriensis]
MELSTHSKRQIDTLLRFQTFTSWTVGIILVTAIVAIFTIASYADLSDRAIMATIFGFYFLLIGIEVAKFNLWLKFVKNKKARMLLSLRYTAMFIGYAAIGYFGYVVFNQTPQPQSFQAFLLSQAFFWGASFIGKWLDRIIQTHDDRYLTDKDLKLIREAREYNE